MLENKTHNFGIMTLRDFAKSINKPESTIRTWKKRGNIPSECFKKVGDTVFVIIPIVEKFFVA